MKNSVKYNTSPWDGIVAWSVLRSADIYPEGIKFLRE